MKIIASALKVSVVSLSLIFLGSSQSLAHEFILKPESTKTQANKESKGQSQAAHVFMISEEAEPISDVVLKISSSNNNVVVKEVKNEPFLEYSFVASSDQPFVLQGWRKPQIWSTTTKGVQEGDKETLEKQGYKVVSVGEYEKFSKVFYNSDKADAKSYATPEGQVLEFIPIGDFSGFKNGGKQTFKVLLRGKPIEIEVKSTYDGYSKKEDEYANKYTSNANGEFTVEFDKPGLWLLQADLVEQKPRPGIDTYTVRATAIFEVE